MNFTQKSFAVFLAVLFLMTVHVKLALADYVIGADDALRITVYGYDDLKTETRVSTDGRISFPLIGQVAVSGKTTFDIEHEIAQMLKTGGFILDPQVTVMVSEFKSQQVSVLGQVRNPGRYGLNTANTLIDIIAMAGGLTDLSDEKAIIAHRNEGAVTKQAVNLREILESEKQTDFLPVQQGDVVYVPKAPMFYIYGEVQRSGSYRVEPKLTVAQALSLGGGLTLRGTERGIIIKRTSEKFGVQNIEVKLTDLVQRDDVIIVDERWF